MAGLHTWLGFTFGWIGDLVGLGFFSFGWILLGST